MECVADVPKQLAQPRVLLCEQSMARGACSSTPSALQCVQAIFRAALLPHPKVNPQSFPPSAAAFAASAVLPLIIFVAYHLVRHQPICTCACLHLYHHMNSKMVGVSGSILGKRGPVDTLVHLWEKRQSGSRQRDVGLHGKGWIRPGPLHLLGIQVPSWGCALWCQELAMLGMLCR